LSRGTFRSQEGENPKNLVGCGLLVNRRKPRESIVESPLENRGEWSVMRKIESSLRSRGGSEVSVKRIEVRKPISPSRENGD